MDLQSIAAGATRAITPADTASIQISTGQSRPDASGRQTPTYDTAADVLVDVQAMSTTDLAMVDALNLTGVKRSIYLHGQFAGLIRPENKGGDLITIASGAHAGVWLVAMVLENWPDWCKVAATLQNQPPS